MRAHPYFLKIPSRSNYPILILVGLILLTVSSVPSVAYASTTQYSVTIANYAFQPLNISITTGTMVIWTNRDTVAHTVTSSPQTNLTSGGSPLIESGNMNPNQSFNYTFNLPGYYPYQCSYHYSTPSMNGWVMVTGNPVTPPPGSSNNSGFPILLVTGIAVAAIAVILAAWLFLRHRSSGKPMKSWAPVQN
jgi:plastocyanin